MPPIVLVHLSDCDLTCLEMPTQRAPELLLESSWSFWRLALFHLEHIRSVRHLL